MDIRKIVSDALTEFHKTQSKQFLRVGGDCIAYDAILIWHSTHLVDLGKVKLELSLKNEGKVSYDLNMFEGGHVINCLSERTD